MSFISYAQNYEDVMLWRALKHIKNGFYIDVGAAWPDHHSVTKAFYDVGWRGINIEPNQMFEKILSEQRSLDINLRLALGNYKGKAVIKIIKDTGLSTVSDTVAKSHKDNGWISQDTEVEITTLEHVCNEYISVDQPIHFLKIDVEGLEKDVLQGNDWSKWRPWVVVVEATIPTLQTESYDKWESILIMHDYTFAYADGLNRFYVATEHSELLRFFNFPPNIFDKYKLSIQANLESEIRQAEERAKQAEEKAQQAEEKAQQAEEKAEHFSRELTVLYRSTSWRITAPIRFIKKILKIQH